MEGKGREGKEGRGSEANGSSSKNNINRNHCTPAADIYIYIQHIYTILRGAKRAKRVQHLNFGAAAISNKLRQRQAKGRGETRGVGTLSQQTVPHLHCCHQVAATRRL